MKQPIQPEREITVTYLGELLASIQRTIRHVEVSDVGGIETETRCQKDLIEKINAPNSLCRNAASDMGDGGTCCHSDEIAVRSALAHQVQVLQFALQRSARSLNVLHQIATANDGTYASAVRVRS